MQVRCPREPRCAIRATGGPNPEGARDKRAMGAGSFTARGRGGRRTCRHMRTHRASAARQPTASSRGQYDHRLLGSSPPSLALACLTTITRNAAGPGLGSFLALPALPRSSVAWGTGPAAFARARAPPRPGRAEQSRSPSAVRGDGARATRGSRDVIAGPGHPVASSAPTCPAHSAPACPEPPSAGTRIWRWHCPAEH
jgi:hypothetical protein